MLSLPLSSPVQAFKACAAYVLNPVSFYGAKSADRLAGVPSNIKDLISADAENRLMRERVKQAQWTEAQAQSLAVENQRLRAELGLKSTLLRSPVWARVIVREPEHWYRSVAIDAGSNQGLVVNAPVLGAKGDQLIVVGRIISVRPDSAIVLLLTDEQSSVAAYATNPSTTTVYSFDGLLQGQGGPRLRMDYLVPDATINQGDLVYTSPTSATFPPDVLIGRVVQIFPPNQELEWKSMAVEPAADAARLTEVVVLKTQTAAAEAPKLSQNAQGGASDDETDDTSKETSQ